MSACVKCGSRSRKLDNRERCVDVRACSETDFEDSGMGWSARHDDCVDAATPYEKRIARENARRAPKEKP